MLRPAIAAAAASDGYDLPALPALAERLSEETRRAIPRDIYKAAKTKRLHQHNQEFLARNTEFKHHVYTESELETFMQRNFANTGVLWAYNAVNPTLMAARVDIWRLAVL
jgi:predicted acylesterase/phospholipase RssA